jgi:hypothetical protein
MLYCLGYFVVNLELHESKRPWTILWYYGEGRFVSVHAMRRTRKRSVAQLILNLNIRWRLVFSFTLLPAYPC